MDIICQQQVKALGVHVVEVDNLQEAELVTAKETRTTKHLLI